MNLAVGNGPVLAMAHPKQGSVKGGAGVTHSGHGAALSALSSVGLTIQEVLIAVVMAAITSAGMKGLYIMPHAPALRAASISSS